MAAVVWQPVFSLQEVEDYVIKTGSAPVLSHRDWEHYILGIRVENKIFTVHLQQIKEKFNLDVSNRGIVEKMIIDILHERLAQRRAKTPHERFSQLEI